MANGAGRCHDIHAFDFPISTKFDAGAVIQNHAPTPLRDAFRMMKLRLNFFVPRDCRQDQGRIRVCAFAGKVRQDPATVDWKRPERAAGSINEVTLVAPAPNRRRYAFFDLHVERARKCPGNLRRIDPGYALDPFQRCAGIERGKSLDVRQIEGIKDVLVERVALTRQADLINAKPNRYEPA